MRVRDFILPPSGILGVLIVVVIIVAIQGVGLGVLQRNTEVSEGQCTFKSWERAGGVRMILDCQGKEGWTNQAGIIVNYLEKPGVLTCSLRASGRAVCTVSE